MATNKVSNIVEVLKDAPKNWGRWGADDQIGCLNFLTSDEVLRGVRSVKQGKVFRLGVPVARPQGDPLHPVRSQPIRTQTMDEGFYLSGRAKPFPGGLKYSDDVIVMFPQGTTQYDALGHAWYGDKLYNGYDPKSTIGGLQKCSVQPIAEHGVIGRGILVDVARYKGKKHLDRGEGVTLNDLLKTAEKQGTAIEKHDIVVLHTGWLNRYYEEGPGAFFPDGQYDEPGLQYSEELVNWFHDMEIPSISADTIGCEQATHSELHVGGLLHSALLCNLGVIFNEIVWLKDLADHCAHDGQYSFLFAGAPLKLVYGCGSAVNPIAIK
ncbi:MAG: cyclase family protein [Candidatus Binataceae bacterium]